MKKIKIILAFTFVLICLFFGIESSATCGTCTVSSTPAENVNRCVACLQGNDQCAYYQDKPVKCNGLSNEAPSIGG